MLVQAEAVKVLENGFLNILLAGDVRLVGLPELIQLAMLACIGGRLMIYRRIHNRFHSGYLLISVFVFQEVGYELFLLKILSKQENVQLILDKVQIHQRLHEPGIKIVRGTLWLIQLLPLHKLISVIRQRLIAVFHLMPEDFFIRDLPVLWLGAERLSRFVGDAKVARQLFGGILWRKAKQAGGEINHITVRLTAKAVEALIHLHAGRFIVVEGAPAHAAMLHLQAVAFCRLSGCDTVLHGFKQIHRSASCFFVFSGAGRSMFSFASSSASRALLVRSSSSCGKGLPNSLRAVAIC